MSEWDGGDYGHDSGTGNEHDALAHTEQEHDLNQLHQNYGDEHDALHTNEQYGHAAGFENDQNFQNGHHVEYDNPGGSHFEQTDFTDASSHEAGFEQDFGQSSVDATHDQSAGELDSLREHFEAELTDASHDWQGGEGEISAVNK
jgi:hypothetical protein